LKGRKCKTQASCRPLLCARNRQPRTRFNPAGSNATSRMSGGGALRVVEIASRKRYDSALPEATTASPSYARVLPCP